MKGLKLLLDSLGIKINPTEIETAWNETKTVLPKLARAFDEMNERQKKIEAQLERIENSLKVTI